MWDINNLIHRSLQLFNKWLRFGFVQPLATPLKSESCNIRYKIHRLALFKIWILCPMPKRCLATPLSIYLEYVSFFISKDLGFFKTESFLRQEWTMKSGILKTWLGWFALIYLVANRSLTEWSGLEHHPNLYLESYKLSILPSFSQNLSLQNLKNTAIDT